MIEFILSLAGAVSATIGFVCIFFGVPVFMYNIVRMVPHRNDAALSWHDSWGLNRISLLFFPSLLNEEGRLYQKRAVRVLKVIFLGMIAAILAGVLLGTFAENSGI